MGPLPLIGDLALDSIGDLFPVNSNFLWGFDAYANLVPLDTNHLDDDVVADRHGLVKPTCKNEQFSVLAVDQWQIVTILALA
jgi:hypothetical protein